MQWFIEVVRKYAVFEGRAGRPEFWYYFLFYILIIVAFTLLAGFIASLFVYAYYILVFALLLPSIGVGIRRLHDRNMSGWWMLLGVIPLGGIVLLIIQALPGTPGPNRFGDGPAELKGSDLSG